MMVNKIESNPHTKLCTNPKIKHPNTLLFYLHDDNILHPDLYKLLDNIDNDKIYTFNQCNRLKGNNWAAGYIKTAIIIVPFNLCKNIKWKLDTYEADGYYITEIYDNNRDNISL
jgi:hypothetical protein